MTEKGRHIGLPPAVWGPIFWNTIHIVALGYSISPTEDEKTAAKHFYESLVFLIPCPICRVHYKSHLAEMPVDTALGSRSDLIEWTWKIHNKVNAELGKPEITIDQFLDHISSLKSPAEQCAKGTSVTKYPWMTAATVTTAAVALIAGVAIGYGIVTFNRKTK